ncbi:MAG: Rrf2 family transcriptional regulator [bacterium]
MSELLHVSEAAALAVHAALLLARKPVGLTSVRDIADTLKVSRTHLAKVLQVLERADLVRGVRGPAGGYRLARPPRQITLRQVYEAVEGPTTATRCMFGIPACDGTGCPLGGLTSGFSRRVLAKLDHTRLSDLKLKLGS